MRDVTDDDGLHILSIVQDALGMKLKVCTVFFLSLLNLILKAAHDHNSFVK